MNHPFFLLPASALLLWLAARLGVRLGRWRDSRSEKQAPRESLEVVVSATLTLLGLIISFTFSMATTRYDLRRLYEEQEANAIGTEYVRAAILPAAEASEVKHLLTQYLARRIEFYDADDRSALPKIDAPTMLLQSRLWAAVQPQAAAQPNPVTALIVSGMNDVLNSQGYTQFAWWNRIPTTAWSLAIFIAVLANLLVGYSARKTKDPAAAAAGAAVAGFGFLRAGGGYRQPAWRHHSHPSAKSSQPAVVAAKLRREPLTTSHPLPPHVSTARHPLPTHATP